MTLRGSAERYGSVAIVLHWLSAALIIALLAAGFVSANTADPATKAAILRLHAPTGVLVLALTLLRLVWWLAFDRRPAPLADLPPLQDKAAGAVHGMLYVTVLVLAGSGVALMALSGARPILMGEVKAALPDFWTYPPRYVHAAMAWLLALLLATHVAAALHHQLVRRDHIMRRMRFGGRA
jgi:cytochrome b561